MIASSNTVLGDDSGGDITDQRATYDFASDDVAQPALVDDLRKRIDGDVRFDTYTRQLYATDASAYGVCKYLNTFRLDENVKRTSFPESVAYHGHCHQKATKKDHHAVGVLRRAGYEVGPLDSGCCGMAGTFGYEAEHYSLSRSIGDILFEQIEDSGAEIVTAPGTSYRTQLSDGRFEPVPATSSLAGTSLDREEPPTPVELLAHALPR